ncbi:GMC family oxidoreductase [Mesorhizobium sp. M00.F.Ca.ET.216.01.1.1]|uniref:GMC family oxidoreductase N-terminal domain-containing protein n=1 Tax=Mesorhizobium sp. M00.F.Ca.ET.216.01.1.1 TaxID=2500528 RepID=UPI000FD92BC8|nr:GMC family oxidoreductase [Mesorhizobium sp. M00.F.Ca.ET.216.01.1.1]TGQ40678.1 GMC family oxidoreductase [Mesorhizobium sp. M00.F.Ca.ET.216.01.1.1]TJW13982.1 MAG: FAD-binding protein [Mesorhizobium sp.]TJW44653.1 MAG: FAD-binding protein [Mesorhizobium sp.]
MAIFPRGNGLGPDKIAADVVVIGSGPGGAVTASMCAEAGKFVVMLEEGQNLPLESAPHFSREEILQKYRNAGVNIGFGAAKIAYVEGCCVGGGSEVNRGLYHRAPEAVFDRWRSDYRVDALSLSELTPHFAACEKVAKVEYLPGPAPQLSTRLEEGAHRLGWACLEVPRLYAYATDATGAPGRKQSMSETFVPRFLEAGGELMPDTCATRIARSAGRWTVHARRSNPTDSQEIELTAKTVFVAGGAVQTPLLLRRSGIRRNVGDSLRFHPMLKVVALFADEINTPGELEPVHQIKEFDPRFSMGCSMSKRPALALAMAAHPQMMEAVDRDWRRMAIYYVQSTGGIGRVRSFPGFRDPFVRVELSPLDLKELAEGLTRLAEVLFAAGAQAVYPSIPGYPVLFSPADIPKLPQTLPPKQANVTTMHLFSSCPMGEDMHKCATSSFGRVHGADNLFIADASLLCGPTVVNPQGTVMAVAHRNVTRAIEDRAI